jgi:hypothetical protein
MEIENQFLGHEFSYWIQRQVENINVEHLINECYRLRSKVSFYESRIIEMNNIRELK